MNKYYNTFVYLDGSKIKLITVFNLENNVKVEFKNYFTHPDEKSIEFQDKINSLIIYYGKTIRHKIVLLAKKLKKMNYIMFVFFILKSIIHTQVLL